VVAHRPVGKVEGLRRLSPVKTRHKKGPGFETGAFSYLPF